MSSCPVNHHGMSHAKGCAHLGLGHFSKLFPDLTPLSVSEEEAAVLGGLGGIMHDQGNSSPDSSIPAGYTFFAQFVDHDITLDVVTDLHGNPLPNAEISKLPNLRSPSLDLDCIYGFGPEASPHLYNPDAPGRLLTGNAINPNDVPRNAEGRALIGDPRNDENLFVSQLQLLFLRFHNRVLDSLVAEVAAEERFIEAQKLVRYHYQYLVLNDFLKRVCDPKIYQFALNRLKNGKYPIFYKPDKCHRLPMPVEFSVAAYRFGHSMVRSNYAVNGGYPSVELFDEEFGTEGFSAVPQKLTVDWRFLLEVDDCLPPLKSKAIDHLLADELIKLPVPVVGEAPVNDRSLAFRNLLRGNVLALPSGQAIAQALHDGGYNDIGADFDLEFDAIPGWADIDPTLRQKLAEQTPLFFYMMREAGVKGGTQLGRVGSAVLLEVFLGMLTYCKTTYINAEGYDWSPDECIARNGADQFELADIVRYAGV